MAITRAEFLKKRTSTDPIEHKLPDGDSVLLKQISARLYRDYKRFLRDKDGTPIAERQRYGDELLVGRLMVEEDGSLMFSDDDILAGVFDELKMFPLASVISKAYEMLGMIESDEGREKNSSGTDSTAPS
jgi:hypothetical protein